MVKVLSRISLVVLEAGKKDQPSQQWLESADNYICMKKPYYHYTGQWSSWQKDIYVEQAADREYNLALVWLWL